MDMESPLDTDDLVYPCKGCGDILEEGKAFELAGHRWHLECFKCNTCGTILDSDANLLLLGDGSLICNNCTYSCSACGNKIQDLAILTGDQAYCAGCFRCRNCKKKIENLRYARTSQGMFCMDCHDALMARRRKKTRNATQRLKQQSSNAMLLDKSLPSLPPSAVVESTFSPDSDTQFSVPGTPTELPAELPSQRQASSRTANRDLHSEVQELDGNGARGRDDPQWNDKHADTLGVPGSQRSNRNSAMSDASDGGEGFFIPMALDPSIVPTPPVLSPPDEGVTSEKENRPPGPINADYFARKNNEARRNPNDLRKDTLARAESRGGSSQTTSPRTSFKENGRKESETRLDILGGVQPRRSGERARSRDPSPLNPRSDSRADSEKEQFRLQEAPAAKKKGPSAKDTIFGGSSGVNSPNEDGSYRRPSVVQGEPSASTTRSSAEGRRSSGQNQMQSLPKRGDSLQAGKANSQQTIARKEVGSRTAPRSDNTSEPPSAGLRTGGKMDVDSPSSTYAPSPNMNGGKLISKPMESPLSKSFMDVPQRSERRAGPNNNNGDAFSTPRDAPDRPKHQRGKSASISTIRSGEAADASPNVSRIQASDLSSTDERPEGDEGQSFLKRVSNSVRHARSHSDRTIARSSRDKKGLWPQTPNGASVDTLMGASPALGSPDSSTGVDWYRNALRKAQSELVDRDEEIQRLKGAMEGKTTIKQMNTELREKRSTMVVLDSQKEIVVRELEVLTDHIEASKRNNTPLDTSKLTNGVLRDFADSLQRLKDSFAPQIEELLEKKLSIEQETNELAVKRDRVMTEFETLSIKNAQLTDINNDILQNNNALQSQAQQPQGLGIYAHQHQDPRAPSIGGSTMRAESHISGSTMLSDLTHEEPVLMAPKVVDVRKGQAKKFNWKKGGIVAKSVGKGLKDAFSSDRGQPMNMEGGGYPQSLEGTPYGHMQSGAYPSTTLPKDYKVGDPQPDRAATFGLFGQQKGRGPGPQQGRTTPLQGGVGIPPAEHPSMLYGSELQSRADFEGVEIPGVIVRCIQEVQSRGMDVEGIYRKSGGSSQIQEIKDGFSRDNKYDISDDDLDIHAVTSALKQYFRKLPTPLITFEVYDKLLATAPGAPVQPTMGGGTKGGEHGEGAEKYTREDRIERTKAAIAELPKAHRATLEFLVFHLDKVVRKEKVNLMTSLNCAVVFAPTIMRPLDIMREMTDTASKNDVVRFMIQNCSDVFPSG